MGPQHMGLFGTHKATKGSVEEVAGMISTYFKSRGLNPNHQELKSSEGCGWWMKQGSAKVYIFVQDAAGGPVLRLTSPLVFIPKENQEAFFRRLLDINCNLSSCALATHGDVVLVVAQRPTLGLNQEEVDELAWSVAYVADLLDEELSGQFKAQMYSDDHA